MLRRPTGCVLGFRLALLLLIFLHSPKEAEAQSNTLPPLRDTQVWTDFSAVHSLRDKTDIFVEGGLRWGRNATGFIYERLGGGVAFTPRKYLTLGPRYSIVETEPTATQELGENRLGLESTFTASLRRWTISDRNVIERRFRQPRDSTRYRNRLRLERAFRFSRRSAAGNRRALAGRSRFTMCVRKTTPAGRMISTVWGSCSERDSEEMFGACSYSFLPACSCPFAIRG
ncbi:MAG: hypothetical protein DMG21_11505 [Acidobacteria bacterium]|nr:MAG: hypothetical protein DMG21_11505 [Acidobacteriota bacterium]